MKDARTMMWILIAVLTYERVQVGWMARCCASTTNNQPRLRDERNSVTQRERFCWSSV